MGKARKFNIIFFAIEQSQLRNSKYLRKVFDSMIEKLSAKYPSRIEKNYSINRFFLLQNRFPIRVISEKRSLFNMGKSVINDRG
jgi:hypothetical protein